MTYFLFEWGIVGFNSRPLAGCMINMFCFVFYLGTTRSSSKGLLLFLYPGIIPGKLGGTYGEPRMNMCQLHLKQALNPFYYLSGPMIVNS